ncbi:MAG: hypothetical protein ND866_14235 [Pyrinomonadaceae bacterium]|nr:hypothetical protein [Pyrinomonadaceae bacterium]
MPDKRNRANKHDDGCKEVGQIREVAEVVDYAETALNVDNKLCGEGRQESAERRRAETQ